MADLITNLQSIYNTKLQIKNAIGTDSDIFSDYPSYITSLKPSGYAYITTNGDHNVNSYSYVNVNVPQGGAAVLGNLTVSENGQYSASSYSYDGFDVVDVNVPAVTPVLNSLSVYANGVYTPQTGVDGFNEVTVNVPSSGSSHSGQSTADAWTIEDAYSYISAFEDTAEHMAADLGFEPVVEGVVASVLPNRDYSSQYPTARFWITRDGSAVAADYSNGILCWNMQSNLAGTWTEGIDMQIYPGQHVFIQCTKLQKYLDSNTGNYQMECKNGTAIVRQTSANGQLTITQSGTYDTTSYVSVVVDLTPAPATISKIQYSTGNTDGGVSSQVGDNWADMTEDPVTGVFSTPASDSTHYNGNNYGGYIAFRTVYSDNSYTYLNVPHGYNNSIQYNTSGVCTEESSLTYFTWNDTFATNHIEINKNTLNFSVNRSAWELNSWKCSYDSSTGDYTVVSAGPGGTIANMNAKLSGFESSYYYKFVCTTANNGRIIQDNIFATEQVTLQDNDYNITLDTSGSYYVYVDSTQTANRSLNVSFSGAESFRSISANWQNDPYITLRYTSAGVTQNTNIKSGQAGTITIDSQQVVSVNCSGGLWVSSEGATCNSSSSGQSISLIEDMDGAQNSNVTFEPGQYSITPTINGDSMMIYGVSINVSYIAS